MTPDDPRPACRSPAPPSGSRSSSRFRAAGASPTGAPSPSRRPTGRHVAGTSRRGRLGSPPRPPRLHRHDVDRRRTRPPPPPPLPKVPTHGIVLDQQGSVPVAAAGGGPHPGARRPEPGGAGRGRSGHGRAVRAGRPRGGRLVPVRLHPGGAGSAVLAGHVDWKGRPGAFIDLDQVQPGERIEVDLGDGTTHAFVVAETHLIVKTELPPELFDRSGPPKLVLITCGGDSTARSAATGRTSWSWPPRRPSGRLAVAVSCAAPGSTGRRCRRGRRRAGRARARRGCCA